MSWLAELAPSGIWQAPMANVSAAPLAAAVTRAGGFGAIGSATMSGETVEAQVRELRAAAGAEAAFQLNFFVHAPPRFDALAAERVWRRLGGQGAPPTLTAPPPFDTSMLERVLALAPPVVSFHFGLPDDASVRALRAARVRVVSTATSVAEARWLRDRGVDAIVAQGIEAGGHRGSFATPPGEGDVGTLALVPQIVDAVDGVPVIAAGGLHDGRGIAAVRALGAAAAQLGTAFLGCPEANVSAAYAAALRSPRAAATRVTTLYSGRPARALLTPFVLAHDGGEVLDFPLQRALSAPFDTAMWAGQAAAKLRPMPAATLVTTLRDEAEAAQRRQ